MAPTYLERNLCELRERLERAARACGREPEEITLLAAVKYAEPEELQGLLADPGVRCLGENRVQQLLAHYESLPDSDRERVAWHFIGTLQTNKVKYIIDKVCMIHSVDSLRLAAEIDRQAAKHGLVMDILAEVNSGEEENKSGVLPAEAEDFCRALADYPHLRLRGLMTMAPRCENRAEYAVYFNKTRELAEKIWEREPRLTGRPLLSMGMSESFEEAIACGADIVRVGRGLFVK